MDLTPCPFASWNPARCQTTPSSLFPLQHIVSILEPKAEIVDGWKLRVETSRVNEEPAGPQDETELLPKPERPAAATEVVAEDA